MPDKQIITVPTGHIIIIKGDKGLLECLSIGDYGKEKNIKADFMGLTKEIDGVPHGELIPLEDKWVITISSQYGCSMDCQFCDVPKVGPGRNATFGDLLNQVIAGLACNPQVLKTKRLNLHYARMGEPTFNWEVINSAIFLAGQFQYRGWGFHPVVSTMMPNMHTNLRDFLIGWMHVKNVIMEGNAGLQISLNSTDDKAREFLFGGKTLTIPEIARRLDYLEVKGRKIALNFAVSEYPIDGKELIKYFNPEKFMCKLTPMHLTTSCVDNKIITVDGYDSYYPYREAEKSLKDAGYDVIVFIPSKEEDESMITCGNAILAHQEKI